MQITNFIGNTPLVSLRNYPNIYVKLEGNNIFGSIKDRVALAMIDSAENEGLLQPNSREVEQTVLEASGGSTGWAINCISKIRGYRFTCVLPDNYSAERILKLKKFGANVVLSDHTQGNDSHFLLARNLESENPSFLYLDQLSNPSNPNIHYSTTAVEILRDVNTDIDFFVCGVGSGGTISGIGKKLKERFPKCEVIAVQPKGCEILKGKAVSHRIQGWAVGLIPKTFNVEIVDKVLNVSYEEAIMECKRTFIEDGLYIGISSGANIYAAKSFSVSSKNSPVIVTVAPDQGHHYLNEDFINFKE